MDQFINIVRIAAIAMLLAPVAHSVAAEPPTSGVGVVSLDPGSAEGGLREVAERLAARVEAAATIAEADITGNAVPASTSDAVAADADDPVLEARGISDRFGLVDRNSISEPVSEAWWETPEARVVTLLILLGGAALMARRFAGRSGLPGARRPSGILSVLARYPFGRGASLVLLECGPRLLLLHQHGGRGGAVTTVAEFTDPVEIAELRTRLGALERSENPPFQADLVRNLGLYDRKGRPEGFGGPDGVPMDDAMETVDLTRRRPRSGVRRAR